LKKGDSPFFPACTCAVHVILPAPVSPRRAHFLNGVAGFVRELRRRVSSRPAPHPQPVILSEAKDPLQTRASISCRILCERTRLPLRVKSLLQHPCIFYRLSSITACLQPSERNYRNCVIPNKKRILPVTLFARILILRLHMHEKISPVLFFCRMELTYKK